MFPNLMVLHVLHLFSCSSSGGGGDFEAPIGGVWSMFAMYSLRLADWRSLMMFAMYNPKLVEFGTVRRWSPIGGVVDEVRLQAPVGGVISKDS
ncbi:hypothetical protein H5410_016193 [Solanum commersonii]|uniref:Secreted protein n=1 Tax=Solanum commersonii TaxID=4109 RepID=A0A9J5ZVS8_SOLCO|nr:hypothetical protein H5410_016193 [Solanum commersonii]